MCSKMVLCGSIVLVLFVVYVQSTMMGGGQGPIIIRNSDRKNRNNDMFFIGAQTKCGQGPIIASTGGRKRRGQNMIMIGGAQCMQKKTEEKIIPVPYPVKEQIHVPVPYKETVHVPVHVPVHIPVQVKEEYGGYGGGDMGGYGGGMDMGGYGGGYARRR